MTVLEFVDLCLIKISGGELNNENAVWRADVKAYVAPAVHETIIIEHGNNMKEYGDREVPGSFLAEYTNLTVTRSGKDAYITLTKPSAALASNGGIKMIMDDCGQYNPMPSGWFAAWKSYYSKIFTGERFYRPVGRLKIYLYNSNPLLETLASVIIIQDVSTLDWADHLPLAAGLEGMAIDRCVEFFTGQRQVPANLRNDARDIN